MKKVILHSAVTLLLPVMLNCIYCMHVFSQEQDKTFVEDEVISENGGTWSSQDTMVLRAVPDTIVDRFKQQKTFEYANDPAYWTRKERKTGFNLWNQIFKILQHPATRFFFYLTLITLAVFVTWRIVVSNNLFRKRPVKSINKDEAETLTPDAAAIQPALDKAILSGDYRLAVRFLYLRTLYALNDKELIRFDVKTTNQEYLEQINSTPFASSFKNLMHTYEYVWYGEFFIGREQFDTVYNNFTDFQNRITY